MRNEILTTYYTGILDPQRKIEWKPNFNDLLPLLQSIKEEKIIIISNVFADGEDDNIKYISRPCIINPYFQRWIHYYQYLRDNPDIEFAFCVDATDVLMINNPFGKMKKGIIYCGDEPCTVGKNEWMINSHPANKLRKFFAEATDLPLLNAGVIGGDRQSLMEFIHAIVKVWHDNKMDIAKQLDNSLGIGDMGAFNFVAYKVWEGELEHGRKVTNEFKSFKINEKSWFKHK